MVDHNAGIGNIVFGKAPDTLSATALGSCIGVVLYDPIMKIAALAHIALPSMENSIKKAKEKSKIYPGRYADIAIPETIKILKKHGAVNLQAKITGGSKIFNIDVFLGTEHHLGKRSLIAVEKELKRHGIRIVGKDVEGSSSRTIKFYPENGLLQINKTILCDDEYKTIKEFI